jgi:hypothetical protein
MCFSTPYLLERAISFFAANKKWMPFIEAAKVLNLGIAKDGFKKAERKNYK